MITMTVSYYKICFLVVWLVGFLNGYGSALDIEINPKRANQLLHENVKISCKMDKADASIKEIVLLELSKDDKNIVVLRSNSQPSVDKSMESKMQVEGNISNSVVNSFLHVTLVDPEVKDSGYYTCLVYYLDQLATLKQLRINSNLVVSDEDVKSTVRYLVDAVSSLTTELKTERMANADNLDRLKTALVRQKNEFKIKERKLQKKINQLTIQNEILENQSKQAFEQLNDTYSSILDKVIQLQNSSWTQNQIIDDLITNEHRIVHFVALHTGKGTFQAGHNVVYSDVIVNEGQGYNGQTGIFTAPVSGYYLFHISMASIHDNAIYLDLKTGNGDILARILTYDLTIGDFSDGSCVAKLVAGEYVRPVVRDADRGFALDRANTQDYMNKFDGFLLKAL